MKQGAYWTDPSNQGVLMTEEAWDIALAELGYVKQRKCRLRGGECDQCGAIVHEHANLYWKPVGDGMRTVECRDVRYCPNCGAKVVEA